VAEFGNVSFNLVKADARTMREQALLQAWGNEGFFDSLWTLVRRGTRERIRAAIEDRAAGRPGALSPQDTQALEEWLAKIPEPTPEALRALSMQRLAAVTDPLHAEQIDATRVVQVDPTDTLDDAEPPTVKIRLRPVKKVQESENGE